MSPVHQRICPIEFLHGRMTFAILQVEVTCSARVPSSSGRQGEGTPYFATPPGQPLRWTLGSGRAGAYFEEGVCSLGKGERAFLSCPAEESGTEGLIPPAPSGAERVEYEVELLDMVQVSRVLPCHQLSLLRSSIFISLSSLTL